MIDDARMHKNIAKQFADHRSVNDSAGEYVRGNAHTNTVEGFFSVFKRGMTGMYQHCSSEHSARLVTQSSTRPDAGSV